MSEIEQAHQPFVTLHLEISDNFKANLTIVAKAMIEFEKLAREMAFQESMTEITVEFDRAEVGSLRIYTELRNRVSAETLKRVSWAIVIALLISPPLDIVKDDFWRGIFEKLGYSREEAASLTDEDIAKIVSAVERSQQNAAVQGPKQRLYQHLQDDTAIVGFGLNPDGRASKPPTIIPREQFLYMAEPISLEDNEPEPRILSKEMDLVLIRPVLNQKSKSNWTFKADTGVISAKIGDADFLQDALAGKLAIPLAEGLIFTATVDVHQVFQDGIWANEHYVITKIVGWRNPPEQTSLLPASKRDQ